MKVESAERRKTRMGFYRTWFFPRLLDCVMRQQQLLPFRERIAQGAEGRVLDVGVGSGLNLALYGPNVRQVCGVDPSSELLRFAGERARGLPFPVELMRGVGEALPFGDHSFDTVVLTFTLCTIPEPAKALAEMRRVLAPGGRMLFAEHGRAPEPNVARWQDRLTPLWKRIGGGCHLNRKPDALVQEAGFRIAMLHAGYLKGPRTMAFVYEGAALRDASTAESP
jgi:ubiquinone/menaquinone biosynthesis C-methylase UbiE